MKESKTFADELSAIATILATLEPLAENQRRFVLKTVLERLPIVGVPPAAPTTGLPPVVVHGPSVIKDTTPKDFLRTKNPQTDAQRIACLAYYLTHNRDQTEFKTADLRKLNGDAHGIRLSNPAVAVMNATDSNKFLAPAGHGKKRITTLGEDVVEALPDQEAVKAAVSSTKAGRRKKSRKHTRTKGNK